MNLLITKLQNLSSLLSIDMTVNSKFIVCNFALISCINRYCSFCSEQSMSMILGVGPTLGFFLVPIIGRASDQCHSRYGRRRPFIFMLSLLLICALIIIPYGGAFCQLVFGRNGEWSASMAMATMVIGAIMLDFTCQTCLTPCEALLSDLRLLKCCHF